jgi:hypothetical protein
MLSPNGLIPWMASSRLGRVTSCASLEGRWTISLGYDESGSEVTCECYTIIG